MSDYRTQLRVVLQLDPYELANVLRAIRVAPNDGDWYGQVLGKIDDDLRRQGFCIDEMRDPSGESRAQYGGHFSDTRLTVFAYRPNTPYPDDFGQKWGQHHGDAVTIK